MSFWIPTFTGKLIDLRDPDAHSIDPIDIAVSLARKPRWNGHTELAYTVAEHSLAASHLVSADNALAALLHDAAEAYLGDVSRPLKLLLGDVWRETEERFERAVARRFNLAYPWDQEVSLYDDALLAQERRELIHRQASNDPRWPWVVSPFRADSLLPTKPWFAMVAFLERYAELSRDEVEFRRLPLRRKQWRFLRKRGAA